MADDLLDYLADTQILGKNVGADLKEGKLTLPVIYTLKTADQKDREFVKKMITDKDFSVQDFEKLIELLKKYGGLQYTIERATENISAAKQALSIFKPSKTKKLLEDIADYALGRSA
jgi:octaprenyl-diphosphate synthase